MVGRAVYVFNQLVSGLKDAQFSMISTQARSHRNSDAKLVGRNIHASAGVKQDIEAITIVSGVWTVSYLPRVALSPSALSPEP